MQSFGCRAWPGWRASAAKGPFARQRTSGRPGRLQFPCTEPVPEQGTIMPTRWFRRTRPAGALFGGIRFRLFGMILLVVLPLLAIHGFDLYQERQRNIDAAHVRALDLAHRGAELYERTILEARMFLDVIAQVPEVAPGSPAACNAFLERASSARGWLRALWVLGTDGRVACATTPGVIGADLSDRPHVRRAMESREFVVSDFFIGKVTGWPMSAVVLPVIN
ncbi:MAG TPA: hypothetical protein VEM36_07125, partial [Xanthobacteraceae bacterium]|nr:hypothetical protein [Xanthobacteraceae bacterium]